MALKIPDFGSNGRAAMGLGSPRDILWPVAAYRLTVPSGKSRKEEEEALNPFEKVLMRIIESGEGREFSAAELAAESCIPKHFVEGVLLRLQDRAYLDEHNKILKSGKKSWQIVEPMVSDTQRFETATIYRELVTGRLLPHVEMKSIRWKDSESLDALNQKALKLSRIVPESKCADIPTERDVIALFRSMKRRGSITNRCNAPTPSQILVQKEYDICYLHCQIIVQQIDYDFRILDPFGHGFSMELESAFSIILGMRPQPGRPLAVKGEDQKEVVPENWWNNWIDKYRAVDGVGGASDDTFSCDETSRRVYPELIRQLNPHPFPFRSMEKLHAAVEWALFYHCYSIPSEALERAILLLEKAIPPECHVVQLKAAAQGLGCVSVPDDAFVDVPAGRLEDFRAGKAEFSTVIALAVLAAKPGDAENPLVRAIAKDPCLIEHLVGIKNYRKSQHHGTGASGLGNEKLEGDAFVCEFVRTLFPNLLFETTMSHDRARELLGDQLPEARLSIQAAFGYRVFNELTRREQKNLFAAEQSFLFAKNGDMMPMLNSLYPILQELFSSRPVHVDGERRSWIGKGYVATAEQVALKMGFGPLPDSLRYVKPHLIKGALGRGRAKPSLGACVIAFLLKEKEDTLRDLKAYCSHFLEHIGYILQKCEHGNGAFVLQDEDRKEFRRKSYQVIKSLMEV